jgi:hypothetical protein
LPWTAVAIVLLCVLVLAELVQAWHALHTNRLPIGGARNSLCSVLLVNGQMYYGTLQEADSGGVKISDVYYVRSNSQTAGASPNNQLISRRKADWHAPEWMVIPADKILFIERVGAKSQVATLIDQDRAAIPATP